MASGDFVDPDLVVESETGYKAPKMISIDEILKLDEEDESLRRYKESLLGCKDGKVEIPFPDNPRTFILERFAINIRDGPNIELKLSGDLSKLVNNPIRIPEGSFYSVGITFYVQRDLLSGLRYNQATYKKNIRIDKDTIMLGSYASKKEPNFWTSEEEQAPSGFLSRGVYVLKSRFTDDDNFDHLTFSWAIEIVKP